MGGGGGGGCRGQVGTYSETGDKVSEDGVIAVLMLCTVYLMLHTPQHSKWSEGKHMVNQDLCSFPELLFFSFPHIYIALPLEETGKIHKGSVLFLFCFVFFLSTTLSISLFLFFSTQQQFS